MDIAIMVEGQDGLNWPRWQRLARAVESLGFAGLYRSDHYTNPQLPDKDSLELWVSLTWLAASTERIDFGPLVSPVSFRHPTMTARMAAAVDDLSNGRLWLGVGAGWQEREHHNYGWELGDIPTRFQRFEEGLEVISRLLHNDGPSAFDGEFYRLHDAILLPRPQRSGGPPILIGGNGPRRTLPLTARFADAWNAVYVTPERFAELNGRLDQLLSERGREATAVHRSLMTGLRFEATSAALAGRLANAPLDAEGYRQRGLIVGTPEDGALVDQLGRLVDAGVQRVMLQWLALDDLDGLEALATAVLPHFPS